jgi:hypothetical protein
MKKVLLLTMLLVTSYHLFAFTTQANWRWRNDDGTEVTATWKAEQNTAITLNSRTEVFRLRLEVYNKTGSAVDFLDTLQYATSVSGPWTNLDTIAGSNAFQIAGVSAFVVQDEPTTAQLAGVPLPFAPGKIMVDSMVLKDYNLADQTRTEFEWTIKATPNTPANTTYYFRHWGSTANSLDFGMTYPSLTTSETLPVTISSFNVYADKNRVRLQWTTVTENNNDHFDIERSVDGISFTKIATIKGNGTSSQVHNYTVYDDHPFGGMNYYRIKQFDTDGKYSISDTRSLKMILEKYSVTVYPNPARSDINFILKNYSGTRITAILSTIGGKMIHEETIQVNQSGNTYKLNLARKPASGLYILQLKGEGLSENIKVFVQ